MLNKIMRMSKKKKKKLKLLVSSSFWFRGKSKRKTLSMKEFFSSILNLKAIQDLNLGSEKMERNWIYKGLFVFSVMIICLCGCQASTPTKTVELYLEGIKQSSSTDFAKLIDQATVENQELVIEVEDEIHQIINQISYWINDEVRFNETATVNLTVYGPDLAKVLMDYQNAVIKQHQDASSYLDSQLDEKLNLNILVEVLKDVPFSERSAAIKLKKVEEGWQLEERNEGLLYVLFNLQSSTLTAY